MKLKNNKIKYIKNIFLSLILFFSMFFSCFTGIKTVYAGSVLPDDETFNPSLNTDYSLSFFNLTEEDDSVYVYIYQPANDDTVLATSINISINLFKLDFKNYKLQYVSKNNDSYVFKYLVKDLEISNNNKRVYEISCIYRLFREDDIIYKYDDLENTTTERAFAVEKCYTFLTNEDGTTNVSVLETETIYITDKFVGFVRYKGGSVFYPGSCDSHFVAFSTDKQIDTLKEADVYYTSQSYTLRHTPFENKETFGDKKEGYAYLKAENEVVYDDGFIYKKTYSWNEIETTSQFINGLESDLIYYESSLDDSSENQIDSLSDKLSGKEFVLRFLATDYKETTQTSQTSYVTTTTKTIVGDVAILRLKFETGGTLFEYAAVDDKTTGSKDPVVTVGSGSSGSIIDWFLNLFSDVKRIIIIVLLIILFFIALPWILPCIPAVIEFLFGIIKAVISFLIWLIKLPIKIFKRD